MFIKPYIFYPLLAVSLIAGFGVGGSMKSPTVVNETLKMCNQKPHECKFKYDILMYNETGRVPYAPPKVEEKPKPADKK
jgi:hypothetical protein